MQAFWTKTYAFQLAPQVRSILDQADLYPQSVFNGRMQSFRRTVEAVEEAMVMTSTPVPADGLVEEPNRSDPPAADRVTNQPDLAPIGEL